jgi:hypothetical protein
MLHTLSSCPIRSVGRRAWLTVVALITFAAVYTVCVGGSLIAALLLLLTTFGVYLTLSLSYLCWVVFEAARKRSRWLKSYRLVLLTGAAASLSLATFIDGSYRFWDRPFDITNWAKFVLLAASAWAALFCHLVRDKVLWRGKPVGILKWTIVLASGIAPLAHWSTNGQREEYFLRKNVTQHPNDANAWLELAPTTLTRAIRWQQIQAMKTIVRQIRRPHIAKHWIV